MNRIVSLFKLFSSLCVRDVHVNIRMHLYAHPEEKQQPGFTEATPARQADLTACPSVSAECCRPLSRKESLSSALLDESFLGPLPSPLPCGSQPLPHLSLPAQQDQGSCKPNPYIKKELEKYLEQKVLTVHPCSALALILNQEMALNSRSKRRNRACQHRNQKQSLTGRGERDLAPGRDGGLRPGNGFLSPARLCRVSDMQSTTRLTVAGTEHVMSPWEMNASYHVA